MQLFKIAPILIICLKRFKSHDEKIHDKVSFPVKGLDMTPYVLGAQIYPLKTNLTYDLQGVINHEGELNYGHYTAMTRNSGAEDQWYNYNDTLVEPIRESDIVKDAAYVLFYKLREKPD